MSDGFSEWLANRADDTPPPMLPDGAMVGDFRIVGFLGRGGSGEVYRAEHRDLKFPVAVKVLHRGDEAGRARFAREAGMLADNQTPGFPRFFAYGDSDGRPFLVTELLEERPLPDKESDIASFICKIASTVGELHRRGFVHRDIKPSNILWRTTKNKREPVLIDLGLVRPVADAHAPSVKTLSIDGGAPVGVGTPGYAAPEQFAGGDIDFSSDIHALGVLANTCFGGKPPKKWGAIIDVATSSIPERRYRSADAFVCAVLKAREGRLLYGGILVSSAIPLVVSSVWLCLVMLSPLMPADYTEAVRGTATLVQELAAILVATMLVGVIPVGIFFRRNWARLSALAAGTAFALLLFLLLFADAEHGYPSFNASARLVLFFWWIPRVVTMLLLLLPQSKTIMWHKRKQKVR